MRALFLCGILLLQGCVSLLPDSYYEVEPLTLDLLSTKKVLKDKTCAKWRRPKKSDPEGTKAICLKWSLPRADEIGLATADLDLEEKRSIISGLISRSDYACDEYMNNISAQEKFGSYGWRIAGLAFSTAGAVTTATPLTNVFSSLSTASQGANEIGFEAILKEQSTEAIITAVKEARREKKLVLQATLHSQDFDNNEYTLLLADMADYHSTCGISVGLRVINKALEESNAEVETRARGAIDEKRNLLDSISFSGADSKTRNGVDEK